MTGNWLGNTLIFGQPAYPSWAVAMEVAIKEYPVLVTSVTYHDDSLTHTVTVPGETLKPKVRAIKVHSDWWYMVLPPWQAGGSYPRHITP